MLLLSMTSGAADALAGVGSVDDDGRLALALDGSTAIPAAVSAGGLHL